MFPVDLCPVYTEIEIDGAELSKEIPKSRAVVNTKSGEPLGIVSKNYRLLTNEQALKMGKQCCAELFGSNGAANIEVFNVDAPSTGSYCYIDLIHRGYVMNLWSDSARSDSYIPYVRVTNSYNRSRALRFDIGFCREVCLNGAIFGAETIPFVYNHTKHELNTSDVRFNLQKGKIGKLIEDFEFHTNKLRNYRIPKAQAFDLILGLFRIKDENDIDFDSEKEDRAEYDALLRVLDRRLDKYSELGDNSYALFNAITDIASHSIDNNRYFRRPEIHAMQRLAGEWINSFSREIDSPDFDIDSYLEQLKKSQNGSSGSMQLQRVDYPVQGLMDFDT